MTVLNGKGGESESAGAPLPCCRGMLFSFSSSCSSPASTPPLFRVRNKKETRYCYTDAERDVALDEIKGPEVTRFKGLGEISPKEFGQFIGEGMRLVQVSVGSMGEVEKSLDFFMGKNTPARKDFIVDNLSTEVL